MDGRIALINSKEKLAAVRTNRGVYIIIEILDPVFDLENGECLSGNFTAGKVTKLVNLTKRRLVSAKIRHTGCAVAHKAKRMVLGGEIEILAG